MCNYWAEFIKKGDPNGADADGTPMEKWEAFLEEKPAVMTFFDSPRAQVKPEDEVTAFLMDVTTRGCEERGRKGKNRHGNRFCGKKRQDYGIHKKNG